MKKWRLPKWRQTPELVRYKTYNQAPQSPSWEELQNDYGFMDTGYDQLVNPVNVVAYRDGKVYFSNDDSLPIHKDRREDFERVFKEKKGDQ